MNAPMTDADAEFEARRAAAWTDRGTCRFPDEHAPGHPADLKFSVLFERGEWEDLTESEIIERHGVETDAGTEIPSFLFTSRWDFWWESVAPVAG